MSTVKPAGASRFLGVDLAWREAGGGRAPVSRPDRQPATRLPGNYPDRTSTGRRQRASDQVMIAGRSPPRSLDAPAALLDDQHTTLPHADVVGKNGPGGL
jgi:hypothetical protein